MNIRMLSGSVAAALMLSVSAWAGAEPVRTEPLPQVAEILHPPKPDAAVLRQDVYAGLLAINAPEGVDFMAAGSRIAQDNYARLEQMFATQNINLKAPEITSYYDGRARQELDLMVGGERFAFPCTNLQAHDCVAQTLAQKAAIHTLVANNAAALDRYLQVTSLPYYGTYLYTASDYLPSYQYVTILSSLRLAQAMEVFEAGDAAQGFVILEQERAFSDRMLAHDRTLIGQMIAIRRLYNYFHVVNALMDMSFMQEHIATKRFTTLLAPLTDEQQKGMVGALMSERDFGIQMFYALNKETAMDQVSLLMGEHTPSSDIDKALFAQQYDGNATSNIYYLSFQPAIERASLTLPQVSELFRQGRLTQTSEQMAAVMQQQFALADQSNAPGNMVGRILVETALPSMDDYLGRLYDVQVYMALVNAKQRMLWAGVDTQNAEAVNAFLQKLEAQGLNPYTQQPFAWDAATHLLSTPWVDKTASARLAEGAARMAVHIR